MPEQLHFVRHLHLKSVLEIGTYLGGTTIRLAAALRLLASLDQDVSVKLITVDLHDVNDATSGAWVTSGSQCSPAKAIERLGCQQFVRFVAGGSLNYLKRTDQRFDLIFLDGSHNAAIVYQEIPAALKVLNPGGWILLHDYYPNLKPLYPNEPVIQGPYLAVRRHQEEGAMFKVVHLGNLPWPTIPGSYASGLALLGKN